MGKIYTSVKLLILVVLLTSAVKSYWSNTALLAYEYPKQQDELGQNWREHPQGIFALDFRQGNVEVNVIAPEDIDRNTDSDACTASITVPDATYTGKDIFWEMTGATTATGTGQVGTRTFEKGKTVINYTVEDSDGNVSKDSVEITVVDDQNPELSVGTAISQSADAGQCSATISVPEVSFSDNCPGESLSWTMSGATTATGTGQVGNKTFNIGTTTISYVVIDAAENSTTGKLEIIVTDEEDPKLTFGSKISETTDPGQCTATINIPAVTYSDNCSGESLSYTMSGATTGSGDGQVGAQTFNIGTTTISYLLTDAAENSTTGKLEIIVTDEEAPQLTIGSKIAETTDPGQCTASISVPEVSFSDNCPGEILSWTMSGATTGTGTGQVGNKTFNIGTTTITYVVTDASNKTTTGELEIIVTDGEDPKLTIGSKIAETTDPGQCTASISVPEVSFSDNCPGEILSWTMSGATTGTGTGQVGNKTFNIGTTTISYVVTDAAENSTTGELEIVVTDGEDPKLTIGSKIEKTTDPGQCTATINIPEVTYSDNCAGESLSWTMSGATTNSGTGQVDTQTFNIGTTTISYVLTDAANNLTTGELKITVTDDEKPVISAGSNIATTTDAGVCGASVDIPAATASDNCTVGTPTGTRDDGKSITALYPVGTTTITWNVTDENGIQAEPVTQTITVTDNEKPVITAGANVTVSNITGQCYAGVSGITATATDNCSVGVPQGVRSDGEALNAGYPVGETTITWTVTDVNGIPADEVVQIVTVKDDEAPETPQLEDVLWGCAYTFEVPTTIDNCDNVIEATHEGSLTFTTSGEITWTFEDAAGNRTLAVQSITIDPVQIEATSVVDVLCNGHATGAITVAATGGVAPYTYDWGSLGAGDTKTNLTAGTYSVKAFDANGCETETIEITVNEPETFVDIKTVNTTTGCYLENNGTASVEAMGGTGEYTYTWSNGQTTTNPTVENLAPGTHSVIVTDGNGCTKERSFTISQPQKLEVSGFMTTETTLYGSATGTATAQISGGTPNYSFVWSNGQTGQTARDLSAGTYTVTVTDANGCTATKDVIIVDSLTAEIVPTSICKATNDIIRTSSFKVEGGTALGGTPPYQYHWTFEGDASMEEFYGPQTPDIKYESIGDKVIHLTVTDANDLTFTKTIIQYVGGCFTTDCGSNDLIADNFFVGDQNGDPITAENCGTANSKFIYIYMPSNPDRYSLNIEIIYSIQDIETGEIKNFRELGCFYEKEAIPDKAQTFPIDYTCTNNVKIEGIQFTFSNKRTDECGEGNKPKCYSTNNEATVHSPLYAIAFGSELLCYGSSSGSITARASGGKPAYQFRVKDYEGKVVRTYQPENIFNGLSAGVYTVEVKDTAGNVFPTREVEIIQPEKPLAVKLHTSQNVTCHGGNDGSATVEVSGGTPGNSGQYIYSWVGIGQTTPTATNLPAGTYTVNVLDVNGCEVSLDVTIDQPAELPANAGPDQVLECGNFSTNLAAVFDPEVMEEPLPQGTWTIVNGPAGGILVDANDPHSAFSGSTGTYTLRWTVPCGTSDDVKISFTSCSTLDFDGVNDHVVVGDKFDLPSGFTLEAWVKQSTERSAGKKTILSKRDNSALNSGGFDLIVEDNVPKFRWNGTFLSSSYPIGTDRWYHIAVISDGDAEGMYVDGIKVSGTATVGAPGPISAPFLIGAANTSTSPDSPVNYFHGWIEEVRIWKKALTVDQIRFLMNQRLKIGTTPLEGTVVPLPAPGSLNAADDLIAYYPLKVNEITNGTTKDKGPNAYDGRMVNIRTTQDNTAPLPYYSGRTGKWTADDTWLRPAVWDFPNSKGVDNSTYIDWNIVVTRHNITSEAKNIRVLGLLSEIAEKRLTIANPSGQQNEKNSGQSLSISHYLLLNGIIDLVGKSQLLQDEGSQLDAASTGKLERDQQGTASSYNYNYWTSPVTTNISNKSYTIAGAMKDGTITTFRDLKFGGQYHFADGAFTNPRKVSTYWLHKFHGTANNYFSWEHIGHEGDLKVGEGYSMKGTSGYAAAQDLQNYTFVGLPNNGTIELMINETPEGENYLVGNPYPSAISAVKFIQDNIVSNDISNSSFNGTLYFWDHFAKTTHYLEHYIGGYAVYNLGGSIEPASSVDSRIDNSDPSKSGSKRPGDYIPVGQAFFVNTVVAIDDGNITSTGGNTIRFRNDHREYIREGIDKTDGGRDQSVFHSVEKKGPKASSSTENRMRIWFKYRSPLGYHRQVLVTADANTTSNFDLGYDAPLIDDNIEDMFWLIHESEFVIQGVPDFGQDRVLPLGVRIDKDGVIRIEIDEMENIPIDFTIYLEDELTGEYHDLRTSSFETAAEAGTTKDRFSIVFHKETEDDGTPEDTEDPDEGEDEDDGGDEDDGTGDENAGEKPGENLPTPPDLNVYYLNKTGELIINNPGKLNIKNGTLYNGLGQKIAEFRSIPAETEVQLPVQLNIQGVYIFNLEYSNGSKSLKFIVE